jgi:hypothetical protein
MASGVTAGEFTFSRALREVGSFDVPGYKPPERDPAPLLLLGAGVR